VESIPMMIAVQILGVLLSLFMLYLTLVYQKKKVFSTIDSVFWGGIWTFLLFVVLFPQSFSVFIQSLTIFRSMDILLSGSVTILFVISFFNFMTMRNNKRKLEDLVHKLAIKAPKTRK
jgi:hypothetical protein